MIRQETIRQIINGMLEGTDYQVCDLQISNDNRIVVEIDRLQGVDLEFCSLLNRHIVEQLDSLPETKNEDYSLEVGSVCLTDPFKTKLQYEKNIGHNVEVLDNNGKKHRGQLVSVDENTFLVDEEEMVPVEGKKRKQKQIVTRPYNYADVKYTKYELKV